MGSDYGEWLWRVVMIVRGQRGVIVVWGSTLIWGITIVWGTYH